MKKAKVKMTLKKMIFPSITINMLLNEVLYIHILINLKCLYFGIMTKKPVKQNKLKQFPISLWQVIDVMSKPGTTNEIVKTHINIDKHMKTCYFYIKDDNLKYNLILDRLWLNRNDVQIVVKKKQFILASQIYMSRAQKADQKKSSQTFMRLMMQCMQVE